jgi:tripartite-type tricarboxylate transporter receptor subunit TctC
MLKSLALLLIAASVHCLPAAAQTVTPYRMIVPFPPGGGTDMISRAIAQKLSEAWGQPVIVDNRPGANGTIGAAAAAKSPADGRTLLMVPGGFAVNPSIYPNLPFDTERDFAPVSLLAENAMVVVVHPSFPPRTIKQLIALLKARPNEVNYGSSGVGSPPHLATELFKYMTGTQMTHIPYKGAAAVATDVVAGHVPMYFMSTLLAVPHVKNGRLRALAVTSARRFAGMPEVPTVAETGVPGYAMTNWYGLTVRAGTPKSAIDKLHAEVVRIVTTPEMKERLANEGATVIASTPGEFAAFLKAEIAKAARIVKAAGMTAAN